MYQTSGADICYNVIPFTGSYTQTSDPFATCNTPNSGIAYFSKGPVEVGDFIYDNICVF